VIDIPGAPEAVVAVVVGDHHQLGTGRHLDLAFKASQVGRAALEIVQQSQHVEMFAQVIPQRHKGFLQRQQCRASSLKLFVNCH